MAFEPAGAPLMTVEPGGGGGWNRAPPCVDPELKKGEGVIAPAFIGTPDEALGGRAPSELMLFSRLEVKSVAVEDEEKFIGGRIGGWTCGVSVGRMSDGMV